MYPRLIYNYRRIKKKCTLQKKDVNFTFFLHNMFHKLHDNVRKWLGKNCQK